MSVAGRKIEKEHENPFDNVFIEVAHWLNLNIFKPMYFTPNTLTTISLLFGIMSPYLFYKKRYTLSSICFLLAHLFDCADGDYARTFNMVTVFGDYYDHFSDIFKIVLLIYVIAIDKINIKSKIMFFTIFTILGFLSFVHLACQERLYDPYSDDFLSTFKPLCKNEKNIVWTRYFGVGTNILFISLFLFFVNPRHRFFGFKI